MTKNSFVMRTGYYDIVKDMSDKQAGQLLKAIFNYVATKEIPELTDVEVKMAFRFVKQDLDYDEQRYLARVEHNRKVAKLGGAPKGNKNAQKQPNGLKNNPKDFVGYKTTLNDVDVDNDVDNDSDINKQHTAPKVAGVVQKPRQLTDLQKFAKAVAERFEEPMDRVQLGIWYKRNCRCLTDILNFCGKNIPLGLETISVCVRRLEKAGLSGGYEAVARNLPEYLAQAKKQMEVINAGN
jgi:hypothetical protein